MVSVKMYKISDWTNIVKGILQGSILSLLLNFAFCWEKKQFIYDKCFYADDNSLYSCNMNLDNIFTNLIQDT